MWNPLHASDDFLVSETLSTMIDTSDNLDFNLITYAELGDIELVESCLDKTSNQSKEKALCKAIINGNVDIVKLILETGINPLVHDGLALNLAVTKYNGNTSIIRAILDKSPSINNINRNIKIRDGTEEKEKDVNFPISNGGFNSIDKKLINNQKDCDINPFERVFGINTQLSSLRNTNLQVRSEQPNSTTITSDSSRKPLEISDEHLSDLPLNAIFDTKIYDLATKLATKKGHIDIVELLLNKGINICNSLLIIASKFGHLDIIKLLFDKFDNIDINTEDPKGYPIKVSIENNQIDVVKYLIEKEVDLGKSNDEPLLIALRKGHGEIVKLILNANKNSELIGLLKESLVDNEIDLEIIN